MAYGWKAQAAQLLWKFKAAATSAINLEFELPRNIGATAGIIKLNEVVKQINIDITGTYSGGGGAVPSPGTVTLGTPLALSSTVIRVYFSWATDAEKIYLEKSTNGTTWDAAVEVTAGTYYKDFTGLTSNQVYYFRARAWNTTAYSAYSTSVNTQTWTASGIEQMLWGAFKTQMQADAALSSYIQKWKFNREAMTLSGTKFPIVKAWIADAQEQDIAFPKRKIVKPRIVIHGVVKVKDTDNLETEKLKFDELIKNAIESDITFNGDITMAIVGNTIFNPLDDSTCEVFIECEIWSKIFTMGQR